MSIVVGIDSSSRVSVVGGCCKKMAKRKLEEFIDVRMVLFCVGHDLS